MITVRKHELVFNCSILEQRVDVAYEDDLTDDKTRIFDTAEYLELINNLSGKVTTAFKTFKLGDGSINY